jgi:hypothetical protein
MLGYVKRNVIMTILPYSNRRMQIIFTGIGEESVIYFLNNRDYPSVTEEIISEGKANAICCGVCVFLYEGPAVYYQLVAQILCIQHI